MVNIQEAVNKYVDNHPFVRISLFENLINYSKLSRKIISELGLQDNDLDAVIVACRRLYDKHKRSAQKNQVSIKDVLENTSLQIRNKISVVILSSNTPIEKIDKLKNSVESNSNDDKEEVFHVIRGVNAITIITTDKISLRLKKSFGRYMIKKSDDLVEVVLKSSSQLENVPGVIAHLYSLLAENGINVVETMSCWTDTILVLEQKDLTKSIELLSF